MKRILINAQHSEEIRVALCKDNHLYDFDLENRTREQKKSNIYKGRITRIEPSLEAAFIEYGSERQGFLSFREIAPEYLGGQTHNIKDIIKSHLKVGDELLVQVQKEERGNKGAALSTYLSLAGRYLVLMPNNPKGGGISRQISGKTREELRVALSSLSLPQGMSIIARTAGIGKSAQELQADLAHLLHLWDSVGKSARENPAPYLLHHEVGVVVRAVRDYLREDTAEVWIDSARAFQEAQSYVKAVMPSGLSKLRRYKGTAPLFTHFGVERQIETAYMREVRLPSGGSIVIDQTEALVSIDINSAKSTKGADVAQTAHHTNLEAADEIARQLRLRDMGGLVVIDFIDMQDPAHQKAVEKRLYEATRHDRARIQFAEISRFGLLEMSRQRLRPSLDEATGHTCPRCHGTGHIRDLRSLSLSIMRQIERMALSEETGEIQADVPTEVAAFLLNEKRESLVYLERDTGVRVTILPHAHMESPDFELTFNPDGFSPSSYNRITQVEEDQTKERGYSVDWQIEDNAKSNPMPHPVSKEQSVECAPIAWLSNLFLPKAQATVSKTSQDIAQDLEDMVNQGAQSLGVFGQVGEAVAPKPSVRPDKLTKDKKSAKDKKSTSEPKRPQKSIKPAPKQDPTPRIDPQALEVHVIKQDPPKDKRRTLFLSLDDAHEHALDNADPNPLDTATSNANTSIQVDEATPTSMDAQDTKRAINDPRNQLSLTGTSGAFIAQAYALYPKRFANIEADDFIGQFIQALHCICPSACITLAQKAHFQAQNTVRGAYTTSSGKTQVELQLDPSARAINDPRRKTATNEDTQKCEFDRAFRKQLQEMVASLPKATQEDSVKSYQSMINDAARAMVSPSPWAFDWSNPQFLRKSPKKDKD